jgi:histidinol phosphatase-like enzyme (inositol monophosphatase family)
MRQEFDDLIARAMHLVYEAGEIALKHFRSEMNIEDKHLRGVFDPVTEADRGIELLIRNGLQAIDDKLAVVGEEFGRTGAGNSYWIVDPIDGTRAFICGTPLWGILLGLVIDGVPVASIMHQPFTNETFVSDSMGARLLHRGLVTTLHKLVTPLRTSSCRALADAIVYSLDPRLIESVGLTRQFSDLTRQCRMLRWGGDCYSFAMLAHGCIDLVVEAGLESYDIVPLIHLIESAGGVVTDLAGERPMNGGIVVAAANSELHRAALEILRSS